jgi:hypothetical protein
VSGIDDQNRLSLTFQLFHEGYSPGQTAQHLVSSCRAGEEVSAQIAALNDRHLDGIGICICPRK